MICQAWLKFQDECLHANVQELYDYEKDPLEKENLFNKPEYKDVLQEHMELMAMGWEGIRRVK